jgi:hypothetical protein
VRFAQCRTSAHATASTDAKTIGNRASDPRLSYVINSQFRAVGNVDQTIRANRNTVRRIVVEIQMTPE